MDIRKLAAVSLSALVPLAAQAQPASQPLEGFYIGMGVGLNQREKLDFLTHHDFDLSGRESFRIESDIGWAGILSAGWSFGNGFRAELEGNFRENRVTGGQFQYPGGSWTKQTASSGSIRSYGLLANVFYDFHEVPYVTPYIGVGAGYLWNDLHKVVADDGTGVVFDSVQGSFAYQGIIGFSRPIEAVAGLSFTTEYRYTAAQQTQQTGVYGNSLPKNPIDVNNANHSVLFGVRYSFNSAPTVVAAAPITAARTYLVFFDWNKADLTDRAKQIIGDAASGRGQGVTRIEVNGYTDRSGSDHYNQGLSERRANAVAAELVRRGVPRSEIVTRGFGEANPLVPTADGVREPQNRRVEIILR